MGVHGGLTMVSAADGKPLALGDTPRIAASLCARAGPDEVLLSGGSSGVAEVAARRFELEPAAPRPGQAPLMLEGRSVPALRLLCALGGEESLLLEGDAAAGGCSRSVLGSWVGARRI